MFGSKRTATTVSSDNLETIIGQGTQFKGTLHSKGGIRIDGELEGDVNTATELVIGDTGQVRAQVKARNATVAGVITGNVEIVEKLELLPSGKIYGDIKVGTLIIGEGATFRGGCEMRQEEKKGKETKAN